MRKSKYLILSPLFFNFNEELVEIENVKSIFNDQNILDLLRFNKLYSIKNNQFKNNFINFVYLLDNIKKIGNLSFYKGKIKYINISNCKILNYINFCSFLYNQIEFLILPSNIKKLRDLCFAYNNIKYLDLYKCRNFNIIPGLSFKCNNPKNIEQINKIQSNSNDNIQIDDLSCNSNINKLSRFNYFVNNIVSDSSDFINNKIKTVKLPSQSTLIYFECFKSNNIEYLDLSSCLNLKVIEERSFADNPLKEIKILDNIDIQYTYDDEYKDDIWNKFVRYYNDTIYREGNYKYEDDEWKWYPLNLK